MMEADFVEFASANLSRTTEDEFSGEDLVDEVCALMLNFLLTACSGQKFLHNVKEKSKFYST